MVDLPEDPCATAMLAGFAEIVKSLAATVRVRFAVCVAVELLPVTGTV